MFGNDKREAEAQRDTAIGIAYHLILLANNGEQMLDNLNLLVQYAVDRDGNQYPYDRSIYVRDRILDKLEKTRGDKSYLDLGVDFNTADRDEFDLAFRKELEANRVPKSWQQAQDDYFHKLSAGHKDREVERRADCQKYFGCTFDR